MAIYVPDETFGLPRYARNDGVSLVLFACGYQHCQSALVIASAAKQSSLAALNDRFKLPYPAQISVHCR